MKVLLLIPYFGETPEWIDYFLLSCKYNTEINWLLYGDLDIYSSEIPENILSEKKSISDFNQLASLKLKLQINFVNPYKICDLRPAFGKIFEDYIYQYDYWGYCDLDIIFGDIVSGIGNSIRSKADIITFGWEHFSGPLTLYKNQVHINSLYTSITSYERKMQDFTRHYYLDENSNFIGSKYPEFISTHSSDLIKFAIKIKNSIHFRFLKKLPRKYDITKVACKLEKKGILNICRFDNYKSDEMLMKAGFSDWKINWSKGILTDQTSNEHLVFFHLLKTKKLKTFLIQKSIQIEHFNITNNEIKASC